VKNFIFLRISNFFSLKMLALFLLLTLANAETITKVSNFTISGCDQWYETIWEVDRDILPFQLLNPEARGTGDTFYYRVFNDTAAACDDSSFDGNGFHVYDGDPTTFAIGGLTAGEDYLICFDSNFRGHNLDVDGNNIIGGGNDTGPLLREVRNWGDNIWGPSMYAFFAGTQNFTINSSAGIPNLQNVRSTQLMFYLSSFNQPINEWDVSQVINMNQMFVISQFNQPIGDWNVSQVTDMGAMFYGSQFNQPIGNWNVSQVTSMAQMFSYSQFNQPIGDWNVSQVITMNSMFYGSQFNQSIGDWDVSQVTDMGGMFANSQFNQQIGNWNVSQVTNMNVMFAGSPFNQLIGEWDVSQVTDMGGMFAGSPFNQLIGEWDVSHVTTMHQMFYNSPFNQLIGNWNVSQVTDMGSMFYNSQFNQLIGNWNVSQVTDMAYMFTYSLFNRPIGEWDVSQVTSMEQMFAYSQFNQPIGDWNVSQVTNMYAMFGISTFNQPIGNWNVSQVTNMGYMFYVSPFNQPIGDWDINQVTNMDGMLSDSSLSTDNYDDLLIKWNRFPSFDLTTTVGATNLHYCAGAAARANLSEKSVIFTGDTFLCYDTAVEVSEPNLMEKSFLITNTGNETLEIVLSSLYTCNQTDLTTEAPTAACTYTATESFYVVVQGVDSGTILQALITLPGFDVINLCAIDRALVMSGECTCDDCRRPINLLNRATYAGDHGCQCTFV
jgi:surface protein